MTKRVLFINNDVGVKQFHLACALTDKYGYECHFRTLYPEAVNIRKGLQSFPHPRGMMYNAFNIRAFLSSLTKIDPLNPFVSIKQFSSKEKVHLDYDAVYISSGAFNFTILDEIGHVPLILDIEDSVIKDFDVLPFHVWNAKMMLDKKFIRDSRVSAVLFGSDEEDLENHLCYPDHPPFVVIYPFVALRTLPLIPKPVSKKFTAVYLGSSWMALARSYRDYTAVFSRIAKSGIDFTVYLLNSYSKVNYKHALGIARRYKNFKVYPFIPYGEAKKVISGATVGITGYFKGFEKTLATYGMKPLEYAYAGVQPVSLGHRIRNLSDDVEYGYVSTPETLMDDYQQNVRRFDFDHHLMDNHVDKLREYI